MDEELLAGFLTESNEILASIEDELLRLEADPANSEILDAIFRTVHTVKGNCGFLGLKRLEQVAHAGENLLGKIRSTGFHVDGDMVSLLLECTDSIKAFIEGVEATGGEPDLDISDLCMRLAAAERLIDSDEQPIEAVDGGSGAPAVVRDDSSNFGWLQEMSDDVHDLLRSSGLTTPAAVLDAGFAKLRAIEGMKPADALKVLGIAKVRALDAECEPGSEMEERADDEVNKVPNQVKEQTSDAAQVSEAPQSQADEMKPELTPEPQQPPAPPAASGGGKGGATFNVKQQPPARKPAAEGSIRVDVALLDELMNQVGELVLSRNRLLRLVDRSGETDLVRTCRLISQCTTMLQEKLLHTRMQPVSTLWSSVPRMVRDISKQLGKRIKVEMEGQETELDRTILAAMKDPMTHIIRNSCDHGIEMPGLRRESGKPEVGTISLSARQESGFIMIDIRDDGGGISAEKIRAKAVAMGVISAEQAATMSDRAALQLIFHPGLSTAEQVSNLSGRGVGMDVVRSEIENVGGTVEIESEPRRGTTLHIRIPLTLAIIPAMIVQSAGQLFAIPQMMVQELITVERDSDAWEEVADQPFYRLRGHLLPILSLDAALGLPVSESGVSNVVVINVGEQQFGIGVDEIQGAEEIVVKPLGQHFQHLDIYGGCSILGDGTVVPILDCVGLTKELRQGGEVSPAILHQDHDQEPDLLAVEGQYILVFTLGGQWYAIPMAMVERIEEIESDRIERSGRRQVLQYRGQVIPVIDLARLLKVESKPVDEQVMPCLIIADQGKRLCIRVDEIVDIVQQQLEIHLENSEDDHFIGTAVIDGRSTEVIDIFNVIRKVIPYWFNKAGDRRKRKQRILYVEDSMFYRNLVLPVLEGMGCETILARNGSEAKQLLKHHSPDLILTDLEMPEVDGFELAAWVRQQPDLQQLPIVTLSSLDPSDYADRASLFQACVKKFEREELLEHLSILLRRKQPGNGGKTIDAEPLPGLLPQQGGTQ